MYRLTEAAKGATWKGVLTIQTSAGRAHLSNVIRTALEGSPFLLLRRVTVPYQVNFNLFYGPILSLKALSAIGTSHPLPYGPIH